MKGLSRKNQAFKGFTLIELLMVVTLLAIISAFVLLAMRQHAQNMRANKVSYEIQQVLQAALTYNALNNSWPLANNFGNCQPQTGNVFVTHYLPNQQSQSSLGSYYCWNPDGDKKQLFWVALQIPGNTVDSLNFANRVKANLPNAVLTNAPNSNSTTCNVGDTCYVKAEITANVQSANVPGLIIKDMGNCAFGANAPGTPDVSNCEHLTSTTSNDLFKITFDKCPDNYEPKIIMTPNFSTMPGLHVSDSGYKELQTSAKLLTCDAPDNNKQSCTVSVQLLVCGNLKACVATSVLAVGDKYKSTATVGASYIAACKQITNTNPKTRKLL